MGMRRGRLRAECHRGHEDHRGPPKRVSHRPELRIGREGHGDRHRRLVQQLLQRPHIAGADPRRRHVAADARREHCGAQPKIIFVPAGSCTGGGRGFADHGCIALGGQNGRFLRRGRHCDDTCDPIARARTRAGGSASAA